MLLYQSPEGISASLGVVLLELLDHQRVDQRGFLSPFYLRVQESPRSITSKDT